MAAKKLEDLFMLTLKDMYHGEKQITKALPKMAKKASNPELRKAFEHHLEETKGQIQRLEEVFQICGAKPRGETCEAIDGLIHEGDEMMQEATDGDVLDAGLISAGQAVEHYEIARYGTLCAWAEQLGMKKVVPLLKKNLEEEYNADHKLNEIAMQNVNRAAI